MKLRIKYLHIWPIFHFYCTARKDWARAKKFGLPEASIKQTYPLEFRQIVPGPNNINLTGPTGKYPIWRMGGTAQVAQVLARQWFSTIIILYICISAYNIPTSYSPVYLSIYLPPFWHYVTGWAASLASATYTPLYSPAVTTFYSPTDFSLKQYPLLLLLHIWLGPLRTGIILVPEGFAWRFLSEGQKPLGAGVGIMMETIPRSV